MSDEPTQAKKVGQRFEFDHHVTWKEFRDAVDKMLTDNGVSHDIPIWYIDFSFPEQFGAGVEGDALYVW